MVIFSRISKGGVSNIFPKKGIKVKFVISILVVLIVCITTVTNLYLSTKDLKNTLIENSLESNYKYAQKILLVQVICLSILNKILVH